MTAPGQPDFSNEGGIAEQFVGQQLREPEGGDTETVAFLLATDRWRESDLSLIRCRESVPKIFEILCFTNPFKFIIFGHLITELIPADSLIPLDSGLSLGVCLIHFADGGIEQTNHRFPLLPRSGG